MGSCKEKCTGGDFWGGTSRPECSERSQGSAAGLCLPRHTWQVSSRHPPGRSQAPGTSPCGQVSACPSPPTMWPLTARWLWRSLRRQMSLGCGQESSPGPGTRSLPVRPCHYRRGSGKHLQAWASEFLYSDRLNSSSWG